MTAERTVLESVLGHPAIAARSAAWLAGDPVRFESVTEAAQSLLCAALATRAVPSRRVWVVCEGVRRQERLHGEMLAWIPEALFLPELEMAATRGALPDPELAAERLAVLEKLRETGPRVIVCTAAGLEGAAPAPDHLGAIELRLARSGRQDLGALAERLGHAGYERVSQVARRGQFAVRGGIVDIFSWQQEAPVRVEFDDDRIESLREFDLDEQVSVRPIDTCRLLLGEPDERSARAADYLQPGDLRISVGLEPGEGAALLEEGDPADPLAFQDHGLGLFEAGDLVVEAAARQRLFDQLRDWREEGWRLWVFCNNEGEAERFRDLLREQGIGGEGIAFALGLLGRGFLFPAARLAVLSDAELFGRYRNPAARRLALRKERAERARAGIDFGELSEGELVVHLEHGIARYEGIQNWPEAEGVEREVLALEFAEGARVYVPLEHSYLVSRYVGLGKKSPPLSALGDARWSRAKRAAAEAVESYAANLLAVQAERETLQGHAFPADTKWQHEFEESFLYEETPDQFAAIADAKRDMESARPMDRLICGDVGFGKTEVAIRAAFKAVMGGRQVAVLAPTTVLAQQHYGTFRERMSDYPVAVEVLSRFRTAREQKRVLGRLAEGGVDIVIGTHRLLSADVRFKDLGLVVIDEEQRFGVRHKEMFKERFRMVDVLTLSATPIPRTLYLSLFGARDMSLIETPPANRLPVETVLCAYDERVIREAVSRELARQGQVYFLHNRIRDIERVRDRILHLCPGARVDIGHGQMPENELEEVMARFVRGEIDVLVSTTIVESGLDIPNANTIIINRADRFGLADLYQLRGRVGRAQHKAYAYLLLPRDLMTVGDARKRVQAIHQYSSLGAGFKIAMRDLEIRGAGNLLGTAQSGHILAVGFELYCKLLRDSVARLKGQKTKPRADTPVRFDRVVTSEGEWRDDPDRAPAFLPAAYLPDARLRIQAYRKLAEAGSQPDLDRLAKEWRDRFGPLPRAADNLLALGAIRVAAAAKKISRVEVKEDRLLLTRGKDYVLVDGRFPRLTAPSPDRSVREVLDLIRKF